MKEQIFRRDVSDIIIATDAGREGELVARWILEKAGNKKPVKRPLDLIRDGQGDPGRLRPPEAGKGL